MSCKIYLFICPGELSACHMVYRQNWVTVSGQVKSVICLWHRDFHFIFPPAFKFQGKTFFTLGSFLSSVPYHFLPVLKIWFHNFLQITKPVCFCCYTFSFSYKSRNRDLFFSPSTVDVTPNKFHQM